MDDKLENIVLEISKLAKLLSENATRNDILNQLAKLRNFTASEDNIYILINSLISDIRKEKKLESEDFLRRLKEIENLYLIKYDEFVPINNNFKDLYLNQKKVEGISTLCPELDKRTGGLAKGTICTIAGIAGSMKTTLALNICYNALKKGSNTCYITLEESPFKLYSKLLSRASVDILKPLKVQEITNKNLSKEDEVLLLDSVYPYLESLKGTIYFLGENDLPNYEEDFLKSKIEKVDLLAKEKSKLKENGEDHGVDILVIDHIQLLKYASNNKDEYKLINDYVSFFRKMSLSFLNQDREVLVILLSQINREGMAFAQKHDGEYKLQHISEGSEIERSSAYILTTYTDAMIQVTKQLRMGAVKLRGAALPITTLSVFADGEYYHVGEAALPEQQDYSMDDIGLTDNATQSKESASSIISSIVFNDI